MKQLKALLFLLMLVSLAVAACAPVTPVPIASEPAVAPATEAATEAATELVPVKIATLNFMSNSPIFLAKELGLFEAQGLDVELVSFGTDSSQILPAVLAGQVDVALTSMSTGLINAVVQGGDIRAVADKGFIDPDAACTLDAWVARTELLESGKLDDPEFIKTLTLTMAVGSIQELTTDRLLERMGLTQADVSSVELRDFGSRIEAMREGTLDIAPSTEPWITRAKKEGVADIWVPFADLFPGLSLGHIVYGPTMLARTDDVPVRFMAAYLNGVRRLNEGKTDEHVSILAEATQSEPDEVRAMCWPSFRKDGMIDLDALQEFQDWALAKGYLDSVVPPEQFWDPSYIEQALPLLDQ